MTELAGSVLNSKSGLTYQISQLEKAGLVRRRPCTSDERAVYAVLTPAGRAALRKAAPVYLTGIRRHFTDHLSATERTRLVRTFDKVVRASASSLPVKGRAAIN